MGQFEEETAKANTLFVEAVKHSQVAEGSNDPVEKANQLQRALTKLKNIISDHPSSDLAVKLINGQDTGSISLEGVRKAVGKI